MRPRGQPLLRRPAHHGDAWAPLIPPVGPQRCHAQTYHSLWHCPLHIPYIPVQNSSPPPRSPTFCDAEMYGNREQQSSAVGPSRLRLCFSLSPTDKQGWASAMPRDESKCQGRAGSLSFWHMPTCPPCAHHEPCPTRTGTAPCSAPAPGAEEPAWMRSPAKLYLHVPAPPAINQGSPGDPPQPPLGPRRSISNLPERCKV